MEQQPAQDVQVGVDDGEPAALQVGSILDGKYQIKQLIGMGGMGSVYLAHHLQVDNDVAIKILHPRYAADSEGLKRFQREARIISGLRHKNIMLNYAFGNVDGLVYMVTEFVQGETLGEIIRAHGPLSPPDAMPLLLQICDAMDCAHQHEVFHRDLKPDNVIVLGNPRTVKLIDFGLAKLLDGTEGQRLTRTGEVVGDPHYMSPEQAQGQILDARSDIYSFGCLMYEVFTGTQPFTSESPVAVLMKQIAEHPEPFPRRLNLPPALEAIVATAMSKNRAARFESFQEMKDILNQFIANPEMKIKAPTKHKASLPSSGGTGARWRTIATAALLLLAVAIGTNAYLQHTQRLNVLEQEQAIAEEKLRSFMARYDDQNLDEILALAREYHDNAALAKAHFYLSVHAFDQGNFVKGLKEADALPWSFLKPYDRGYLENACADAETRLHEFGKAEHRLLQLQSHLDKIFGTPESQIESIIRLADVEAELGKTKEASKFANEAEKRFNKVIIHYAWPGGREITDNLIYDLATAYLKAGEADHAAVLINGMDVSWFCRDVQVNPNVVLKIKLMIARHDFAGVNSYVRVAREANVSARARLLALASICKCLCDAKQSDRAGNVLKEMRVISPPPDDPQSDLQDGALIPLAVLQLEAAQGHDQLLAKQAAELFESLIGTSDNSPALYECANLLSDALQHLGRESEMEPIFQQLGQYTHSRLGYFKERSLRGVRAAKTH